MMKRTVTTAQAIIKYSSPGVIDSLLKEDEPRTLIIDAEKETTVVAKRLVAIKVKPPHQSVDGNVEYIRNPQECGHRDRAASFNLLPVPH